MSTLDGPLALVATALGVIVALVVLWRRLLTPRRVKGDGHLWSIQLGRHASFLPGDVLQEHCDLAPAESLLRALPELRVAEGEALRSSCSSLAILDFARCIQDKDDREAERLAERIALVYSFLSYAYLRAGEPELRELPPQLAVPWAAACDYLRRATSLDYVTTVLANCSLSSDGSPTAVCATFTGTSD